MPVIEIHSEEEWRKTINGSAPVVVDFTATWCGPCKAIAPVFKALSEEFTSVVFLKVDVDEMAGIAKECGVSAMPTFHVYQGGKKVKELVGANPGGLKALVQQIATPEPAVAGV